VSDFDVFHQSPQCPYRIFEFTINIGVNLSARIGVFL